MNSTHKMGKLNLPLEKIQGALLGLAIGDALGWPQERPSVTSSTTTKELNTVSIAFKNWYRRSGGRFFLFEEEIRAGEYSDDTQLVLATLRSLTKGKRWDYSFCLEELPLWLLYERGGGRATKSAAESWLRGVPPWREGKVDKESVKKYFQAGGNGVAMRIIPHALFNYDAELEMYQQIMLNGISTHGHPMALVGALLYGKCIQLACQNKGVLKLGSLIEELILTKDKWSAIPSFGDILEDWFSAAKRNNSGYKESWDTAVKFAINGLTTSRDALKKGALAVDSATLEKLGCYEKKIKGSGIVAAVSSVYLASRYAADPKTGLLEAAFALGADTDTMASMLGGIFGALLGTEWIIPEWRQVQDSQYLLHMAENLKDISRGTDDLVPIEKWNRSKSSAFIHALENEMVLGRELGQLGKVASLEITRPKPIASSVSVKSWKARLDTGQSIYVKKLERIRKKSEKEKGDNNTVSKVVDSESIITKDHLFISYATEDKEIAEWLTLRLTNQGYKVWCDRFQLLGGESYPRDIDKAIKNQTFRMLALISKHSQEKENPRKERTLGHNISRERKVDFIIPILVDDSRPDELDWMISDLTYIPFNKNWAQGYSALIKKLQMIETPKYLTARSKIISDMFSRQSSVLPLKEKLWTNLFEIKSIPEYIYRVIVPEGYKSKYIGWIYYQQSEKVFWSFEVPDSNLEYLSVKWNDNRRGSYGVSPINMATILIKEHLRRICLQKNARETIDGHIFLSNIAIPDGWLYFKYPTGRQTRILATSERTLKSKKGNQKYRYHLSPVFRPVLRKYGLPAIELQIRLHLTDSDGKDLSPGIINRRRKKITKNWWNHEWISRIFAVSQWVFDGSSVYNIAQGNSYEISVSGFPISIESPVKISENIEISSPSTEEMEEEDEIEDSWDEE